MGFLAAPLAMGIFVVLMSGLYTHIEWPGMFLAVLSIAYPTTTILGIPAFWMLKSWKLRRIQHFFVTGALIGLLPGTLLFALVVDPILTLTSVAGSAVGGMVFWAIAVREPSTRTAETEEKSNKAFNATCEDARALTQTLERKEEDMPWPADADGDVFRRLEEDGFDFSKPHSIDYNVDFDQWPPPGAALKLLGEHYGPIEVFEPDEDGPGYVLFKVVGLVTYESVTSIQRSVTLAMRPYGGVCESWGVFH